MISAMYVMQQNAHLAGNENRNNQADSHSDHVGYSCLRSYTSVYTLFCSLITHILCMQYVTRNTEVVFVHIQVNRFILLLTHIKGHLFSF
jgi:hypothetical protein